MKHEYIKYRKFIRGFRSFVDEADEDTVYELVGGRGETIGYFMFKDPR